MAVDIKDIFDASPKSSWQFMCENGQGFYIPAYQREYSWDSNNIKRLFDDVSHGIHLLLESDDSMTFIGTIIAIHDTAYTTVSPIVRPDVPSKVMTIIDGQQRLSTLLLTQVALHEVISTRSKRMEKSKEEFAKWLVRESKKVLSRLAKTYEEDMAYGDGPYQFYPRMIRAYEDQWSRDESKAVYQSPIGRLLHQYGIHSRGNGAKFRYAMPEDTGGRVERHKFLEKRYSEIRNLLQKPIAKGGQESLEMAALKDIAASKRIQEALFNAAFPSNVLEAMQADTDDKTVASFHELVRLAVFANFVLDRVAITVVTAKTEDYAFDMFESLNTTGEPLTAFETFKPRVIAAETLEKYASSESRRLVSRIEEFLETFTKARRQGATSDLLVPFAMAETGKKLSKRLNEQRRYLKSEYEHLPSITDKRAFVRHLAHTSLMIRHAWIGPMGTKPALPGASDELSDVAVISLDLLRRSKHSITIAPVLRYYSTARQAEAGAEKEFAVEQLEAAIRAVTAFSVLWRCSRHGTANIDGHYRTLMRGLKEGDAWAKNPLARRRESKDQPLLPVEELCTNLRSILAADGKVASRQEWVKRASRLPAYQNQSDMARFLLFAAAVDALPDPEQPGLIMRGKSGVFDALSWKLWSDESTQTMEHIAPQTSDGQWTTELYDDPDLIHCLGNLTLLPRSANASVSNRAWKEKRLMYQILAAKTADALESLLEEATEEGIEIATTTEKLLASSKHLPHVAGLRDAGAEWTVDMVTARSERLAGLAWDTIAPWLGLEGVKDSAE